MNNTGGIIAALFAVLIVGGAIFGGCVAYPHYEVYAQRKKGEAELARAESAKKIQIETAKASLDSAQYLAEAEISRAKGVAEANRIVGESLKGNEAYLRYRYIENLAANSEDKATATIIYVPTEAGLPILEAGRASRIETAE